MNKEQIPLAGGTPKPCMWHGVAVAYAPRWPVDVALRLVALSAEEAKATVTGYSTPSTLDVGGFLGSMCFRVGAPGKHRSHAFCWV